MNPIRIFIISDSPLFSRGLRNLLTGESEMEIIGEETNLDRAIETIDAVVPDVVILGGSSYTNASVQEEMHLLKAKPGIRVVGLNLQTNDLFIYRATRIVVESVKDLVEAIATECYSAGSAISPPAEDARSPNSLL
jgi:chemotaxis response regulator CheB